MRGVPNKFKQTETCLPQNKILTIITFSDNIITSSDNGGFV